MKRRIAIILVFASLMGVVFAESNGLLKFYTADDWYALEQSQKAVLPEGLTAFIEGLYVLNTKTKKFHLSNCPNTLLISTENRAHSTLTPEELMGKYQPCGQCHPENKKDR